MNIRDSQILTTLLRDFSVIPCYTPLQWELLLKQARGSSLLPRVAHFIRLNNNTSNLPIKVKPHMKSAITVADAQKRTVLWEAKDLYKYLNMLDVRLVLLKGSAYQISGLVAGQCRIFSDIDILVPEDRLTQVQEHLTWFGWQQEELDEYDINYYLKWMHELPPMIHIQRKTALDIHHNILPRTSKYCPDAKKMINSAVKISGTDYWMLCPEDMILHSACHLFFGGEFENGIRDLSDLNLLLNEFSTNNQSFWESLLNRAIDLNLTLPLIYSLRYTEKFLNTKVPEEINNELYKFSKHSFLLPLMDFLFFHAFVPNHSSCQKLINKSAIFILFVRSHFLKMPVHLLVPHLCRKSWLRLTGQKDH